jgi:pimeloyl-ACP methyl ester carboxylesterase
MVPAIFLSDDSKPAPKPSAFAQRVIRTTLSSDFAFWFASHLAPEIMIQSVLATPREDVASASPTEQQRVRTILRDILPISRRAAGLWADATITTVPGRYEFDQLRTPTLVVTTRNDLFGTALGSRAAARRIPKARLIEYPSGGHVWVGHQGKIWAEIARFLHANDPSQSQ